MKRTLGINLEGLSYYSRGLLYADAMLGAQAFYQGADAQGNPTRSGESVLIFSNGTPGMAGTYKFRAKGNVVPAAQASYAQVQNLTYNATSGYTTADIVITAQQLEQLPQIALQFNQSGTGAFSVSDIELWRPGSSGPGSAALFYQPFLDLLAPFSTLRFMDLLAINNSTLADFSNRPVPGRRNYTANGIPLEHAVALCNQTGKDGWLHLPYLIAASGGAGATGAGEGASGGAGDGIQQFAAWCARNIPLPTTTGNSQLATGNYYVEISNEVWNSMFAQWRQNQAAAATNPAIKYDGMGDPNILGWRQYAFLSVQLSKAIAAAYGKPSWRDTPIRPVLAVQWGNPQVAKYALDYVASQFGPPSDYFYGLAQAPYCTVDWSKPTATPQQMLAALKIADPGGANALLHHAYARQYNLHSLAYEFGFDFGQDPATAAVRAAAQPLPEAGAALAAALSAWAGGGGELACWYNLSYASGNSGNWGLIEDLFTPGAPKMAAAASASPLMWWNDTPLAPPAPAPVLPPTPVPPPPIFSGQAMVGNQKINVQITAA